MGDLMGWGAERVRARIAKAIAEHQAILDGEMGRAPDLRNGAEVDRLTRQIRSLEEMREAGRIISPYHDGQGRVIGLTADGP